MALPLHLQEAHYCTLQSQSNVYGLTKITLPCGNNKMLIASLRGKVVSMEYCENNPLSKEVHFTYIPGDAEIIAIDAFTKCHVGNGVVVGIAFTKSNKPCYFLNIYSEYEPGLEFNLDSIAQGCQNIELAFIPYQLCHVDMLYLGVQESVFLLTGSDQKVHLYREDRFSHTFNEEAIEDFFPELADVQCCVSCLQCYCYNSYRHRLTAVGFTDGTLVVSIVDADTKVILETFSVNFDGAVTSLNIYTPSTKLECPAFITQVLEVGDELTDDVADPVLNLVVTTVIEPALVYCDILSHGLEHASVLPDSGRFDSVLCSAVADVDLDGQNEILLGTYGQELLVYKVNQRKHSEAFSEGNNPSHAHSTNCNISLNKSCTSSHTNSPNTKAQKNSLPSNTKSPSHAKVESAHRLAKSAPPSPSGHNNSRKSEIEKKRARSGEATSSLDKPTLCTDTCVEGENTDSKLELVSSVIDNWVGIEKGTVVEMQELDSTSHALPGKEPSALKLDISLGNLATDINDLEITGSLRKDSLQDESSENVSCDDKCICEVEDTRVSIPSWKLVYQRRLADPLLSLEVLDITGDGVKEIIVRSTLKNRPYEFKIFGSGYMP